MRPLTRRLSAFTKNVPLRLILVVPFILQIAFAIGLVGWLSIQSGYQAVNEVANQFRRETSEHMQQYLQTYITTPHIINQLNADMLHLNLLNLQDLSGLEHYLWHQIQSFDSVNEIKFGTEQGGFMAIERLEDGSLVCKMASRETGATYQVYALDSLGQHTQQIDQRPNYDPRRRPWYKGAAELGKATLIDVYQRFSTPKPAIDAISASLPLYDVQNNFIGIASVDLALSGISEFLQGLRVGRSSKTFVVDRSGRLIGSSRVQKQSNSHSQSIPQTKATDSQDPLIRLVARSLLEHFGDWARMTTQQQVDFALNGDRQFVQVVPLRDDKGLDWRIVLVVPEADFMDRINASTQITVLLCLVAFVVAAGLGIYTARGITIPIFRLSRAAEAIAQGDLNQTVRVSKGANEITVLAQAFNQMAQQLRDSFTQLASANEALELRVEQRTAALQSSEAKFAAAFRSSPYPIGISTLAEARFVEANNALCQVVNLAREDIIGRTSREIGMYLSPDDRIKLVQVLQETGSIRNLDLDICRAANPLITLRTSAELIDLNGEACVLWVGEDVTERKRAEEALRTSEATFVAAFRSSPLPIAISTLAEGRYIDVNDAFCRAEEYSREAVIGHTNVELGIYKNPASRARLGQILQEVGFFHNQEQEIYTRSGKLLTIRCSAEVIDLNGEACGVWVWEDITERKHAEAALQASEAKFAAAFHASPHPVCISTLAEGRFIEVNESFCHISGYSLEEIIGRTSTELHFWRAEDRAKIAQRLQAKKAVRDQEMEFRIKSGRTRTVLLSAELIDLNQQPCILWVAADITERKRIEAALQRSEEKYRNIFESSQVGIFRSRSEDGIYVDANQRFAEMLGYRSPADLIDIKRTSEYYADFNDRTKILEVLRTNCEFHDFEIQLRRRDGSVFWALASARYVDEQYNEGVMIDISDRKAAEAALKAAMEAAEVANRAKSQFLSHMSHELRTPLNAILGFTQLLLRGEEFTATQQNYLETINRSGEHLLSLINNVLELSKIEAGKMTLQETTCDLAELLNWLHQIFEMQATSKGLQLVFDSHDLPRYVQTDESKLRQVLMNLLGNAIKFTQTGGVTLRAIAHWETSSEPRTFPQQLMLSFAVEDTGPGIAPTEFRTLFEPFVQTETGRNSEEGTGLGLPISQKFIRLMGGELGVESQLGKGALFKFEIPVAAVTVDNADVSIPCQSIVGLEAGQPIYRILVAEDKLENRRVLMDLLTSIGFEVREAVNGREAIALWQTWQPDLIWMDLQMPEIDGLQATQQIKASSLTDAPVIIAVTGNAFEEDRIAALSAGCDDFVRKPIQTKIIFDKMAEHLGVRYRCTDVTKRQQVDRELLTRADFAVMPVEWIEQLHQAASNVSAKQILKLVEQIPSSQAKLADAIAQLVRNFQFEHLIELTQRSGS
jgi:PAS domain S-box-containing protein